MRSVPVIRRIAALLMSVPIMLCVLGGCSNDQSTTDDVPPLFKQEIDQALASDDPRASDFERQILSDYTITDEEFAQSREMFRQCMADLGWIVEYPNPDGYSVHAAPGSGNDSKNGDDIEASTPCSHAYTWYVEPIYYEMKINPGGMTQGELVSTCFERHDVTEGSGMSADEFEKMVTDPDYHPSTPAGMMCFLDPTGYNGTTQEEAADFFANAQRVEVTFPPSDTPS